MALRKITVAASLICIQQIQMNGDQSQILGKNTTRNNLLGVNLINQAITIINALTAEGGWRSTFQRTKQVTNQSQPAVQFNDAKIPDLSLSILP